jgi:hypothetical protein
MFRAAAVIVATVAGLLAAEPAFAVAASPVGVWRVPKGELDRRLDQLQDRLKAEYLPRFFRQHKLDERQVNFFYKRVKSLTPVVERTLSAGTLEFKQNGRVIARDGKGKVRGTGQWRVKDEHVVVTGLRLLGDDPFDHQHQVFHPPGRRVGDLVGTDRIEFRPPLAEMRPDLRRAFQGFDLPLVRVTSVTAAAQASEPDAG